MSFTVTFTLNVAPLPDMDYWFINPAAWSNYWANQGGTAIINAIATTLYVPVPTDTTLEIEDLQVNGVDIYVPSMDLFISLYNQVQAIDTGLQATRTQLRDGGLITNAQ
jgi:hypothetical protein